MAYVISRLCRDCIDAACVDACPVDCIVQHRPASDRPDQPNQLYIDPSECIDCSVCEPECPWEAIYPAHDVPAAFHEDIALNARVATHRDEYDVPVTRLLKGATRDEVERNKQRWRLPRSA
jgi:ferredoxin